MDTDRADAVVAKVNGFLAQHRWMDFTVWEYRGANLQVSGSLDETYWSDLRVEFLGVCWACIRFQGWHSDTTRPVLARVAGEEALAVNGKFQIEVGHHIFKLIAEDFAEPMWIAAQGIAADLTRHEFGKQSVQAEPDATP